MKPLSVEMACLLGIQNEIQAVCRVFESTYELFWAAFSLMNIEEEETT